jgi:hypothetical protein
MERLSGRFLSVLRSHEAGRCLVRESLGDQRLHRRRDIHGAEQAFAGPRVGCRPRTTSLVDARIVAFCVVSHRNEEGER